MPTAVTARGELIGPGLAAASGRNADLSAQPRDQAGQAPGRLRSMASGVVMVGEAVLVAFAVPIAILAVGLPIAWCIRLLLTLLAIP